MVKFRCGIGFDPTAVPGGHLGLVVTRERVELLGGQFDVHSQPGSGTTIRAYPALNPGTEVDAMSELIRY